MIDGVSGVDLMNILMSMSPDPVIPEAPPYIPRPAPTGFELWRHEALRRLALPFEAVRDLRRFAEEAQDTRRELLVRARAVAQTLGASLRRPSETPLNGQIGPHRRFDWCVMPLRDIKAVRKSLGGSLNDVVLTVVTGAVRRFLEHRRVDPGGIDFRVMTPVSVRGREEQGQMGNRVSAWFLTLPVGLDDPAKQLLAISEETAALKESKRAVGADILTQVAEWTPSTLLSLGARNVTRLLPFNIVVTNVPGPQVPIYTLGAPMLEIFANVPLIDGTGLGVALMSYDGRLCWGFNADYDLLPDLPVFVQAIRDSFDALRALADVSPPV
jgi:WS/DGAT/MGAT family acyltransferase